MLRRQIALFIFACTFLNFCSATLNAQTANNGLKSSDDYLKIVKYYRYLDPDSAKFYAGKGLEKSELEGNDLAKAALLNQLGMIEDNASRYSEAKERYLQAELIYREANDDLGLAATLIRLSVVEKRKGNYDKALDLAMKALKISEKNNYKLGLVEARVVLSEIYYILDQTADVLHHLKIAEAIDSKLPTSSFTLNMYLSFGYLYVKLRDFDRVEAYVQKGLTKANKVEFNGHKISLYKVLAIAYARKGEKQKSVQYFKYALQFSRKIKNLMREQSTLVELSEVYNDKPDSALYYLQQALVIADKFKMPRQQITVLDKMSAIYRQKQDFKRALDLKEKSSDIAEKTFYKDMTKQVVSLETAYDLEKSQAKLRELTFKNDAQRLQKNIFLYIAIATLLLFCVTLAHFLRTKQLNNRLKFANEELEESNTIKDKFFSIIAHDIRSPLVSTIGILQLINDKEIDEEAKVDMVSKLIKHCQNSLSILDKLLKWGQMQIKGVRINPVKFNPSLNIERNLAVIAGAAQKKGIQIRVNVSQHLTVFADADHFDFIIRNLMNNAVKFTQSGGLIEVFAEPENKRNVIFVVRDNGVGISEARIKRLFELSAMGTRGTSKEEGTSLGLIICKEFVEANKGKIDVQSVEGVGTTFSFTLKTNDDGSFEKK